MSATTTIYTEALRVETELDAAKVARTAAVLVDRSTDDLLRALSSWVERSDESEVAHEKARAIVALIDAELAHRS